MLKKTIETRELIEKHAIKIHEEGYSNLFFISVGGSLSITWPLQFMVKT